MKIKPTVGRKVWYRPNEYDKSGPGGMACGLDKPLDATIVCVHCDTMINVVIFDANGNMHKRSSVTLWDGEGSPPSGQSYCEWMPFQLGQAKAAA